MSTLFEPIKLGAITAPNRIIMAPLTRARATRDHVPTAIMVDYYRQRASAGLIITEATGISQQGLGWPFAPGIWRDDQVAAWKPITEAVHQAGGRIFCQLWHMGRLVHPSFLGEKPPVAPSATTAPSHAHTYEGNKPYELARSLEEVEIADIIQDYRRAAANAMKAGFDGVQLHAANGYLVDQFLRDGTNFRTDSYGGPIENRIRLLVQVTEALAEVVGSDRTAVRLSPNDEHRQGCADSNNAAIFPAAALALDRIGLAFLEMNASRPGSTFRPGAGKYDLAPIIRKLFRAPLILNTDYTKDDAVAAIRAGEADAISFGRPYIANPNLPELLRNGEELREPDATYFYTQGSQGYLDYPTA
ncbi:alkene reductase [Bradyrhizobium viridifuturi]|uniref:alkene reductase n=1 Tax=Bradyrhizobium viridifuturi TaxID=1654716 RepID=UPI00067E7AAC|nr:alkene reductase [Bradyrhizobium viridifuturi]